MLLSSSHEGELNFSHTENRFSLAAFALSILIHIFALTNLVFVSSLSAKKKHPPFFFLGQILTKQDIINAPLKNQANPLDFPQKKNVLGKGTSQLLGEKIFSQKPSPQKNWFIEKPILKSMFPLYDDQKIPPTDSNLKEIGIEPNFNPFHPLKLDQR